VISVLFGLLAGALTTLSPCVLPVLPFVLYAALDEHRFGPLAVAAGMATTFAAVGILISGAGQAIGVSGDAVRYSAAALMAAFGVVLLSSRLQDRFAVLSAPLTNWLNRSAEGLGLSGVAGQFALGALLGAIWSPCSGPTLGVAVTLAASSETISKAGAIMLFFGIGASIPLLAIAYGSRATLRHRKAALQQLGRSAKPILGGVVLAAALLVLSGVDKIIEAELVRSMPDWLTTLTTKF
jgi:cytochrome c biogenesis protein CcdA